MVWFPSWESRHLIFKNRNFKSTVTWPLQIFKDVSNLHPGKMQELASFLRALLMALPLAQYSKARFHFRHFSELAKQILTKPVKNNPLGVAKKNLWKRIPHLMQQHMTPRKGYKFISLDIIQYTHVKEKEKGKRTSEEDD